MPPDVVTTIIQELSLALEPLVVAADNEQSRRNLLFMVGWDLQEPDNVLVRQIALVLQQVAAANRTVVDLLGRAPRQLSDYAPALQALSTLTTSVSNLGVATGAGEV